MGVNYNKLWKLLIDKNMKKQDLQQVTKLSKGTITKLGKNEDVSTATLRKICTHLECDISDIVEFVKED
ncbi:MAG: helix-turn-helix transcriptional regulator [Eubacteriales bacterium]